MGDNVKVLYNYDGWNVQKGSVQSLVTDGRETNEEKSTSELGREKSRLTITDDLASIIRKQQAVRIIYFNAFQVGLLGLFKLLNQ